MLHSGARRNLVRKADAHDALARRLRLGPLRDRVETGREAFSRIAPRLHSSVQQQLTFLSDKLTALERMRRSLGYQATLERGYAVVRSGASVVTGAKAAREAGALEIEFRDGRVDVHAGAGPKAKRGSSKPPEQGSLF